MINLLDIKSVKAVVDVFVEFSEYQVSSCVKYLHFHTLYLRLYHRYLLTGITTYCLSILTLP